MSLNWCKKTVIISIAIIVVISSKNPYQNFKLYTWKVCEWFKYLVKFYPSGNWDSASPWGKWPLNLTKARSSFKMTYLPTFLSMHKRIILYYTCYTLGVFVLTSFIIPSRITLFYPKCFSHTASFFPCFATFLLCNSVNGCPYDFTKINCGMRWFIWQQTLKKRILYEREGVPNTGEVDLLKLGVGAPLPTMCDF